MGLMNFAYGELIMAGAFAMYYTRDWGCRDGRGRRSWSSSSRC